MKDYLEVVYARDSKPLTNYPEKLVDYIILNSGLSGKLGLKMLEPGVGMGDHLRIFKQKGFDVYGFDISPLSLSSSPDLDIKILDIGCERWPYPDSLFDVVYTKSFIEHLVDPQLFLKEAYRVLKPNGVIITLTPDWESNFKKFYDDFTHKTPFTLVSLSNIKKSCGFENVQTFKFRQLPVTWKYPFMDFVCSLISVFVHHRVEMKFFRWSRELMLFSVANKP
jgi:SAM-dependent methyltransferase